MGLGDHGNLRLNKCIYITDSEFIAHCILWKRCQSVQKTQYQIHCCETVFHKHSCRKGPENSTIEHVNMKEIFFMTYPHPKQRTTGN